MFLYSQLTELIWSKSRNLFGPNHGTYLVQITTIINSNFVTEDNYKTWFAPNEKMIHILEKHENEQLICNLGDDFYTNSN